MQMLHTYDPHFLIDMCLVTHLFLAVISILLKCSFTFNCLSSYNDHGGTDIRYCSLLKIHSIALKSAQNTCQIYERDYATIINNEADSGTAANPYRNPQDSMKGPSS